MLIKRISKSFIACLTTAIFLMVTMGAVASAADQKEKGKIPAGPINIGFAVPMSGVAATLSPNAGVNAELAAEYMNKYEGGILGRPVKAIIYDTKANAKTTVELFGKLIENDKVEAVLGCLSSSTAMAVAPKVEDQWKIPTLLLEGTTMAMFTTVDPKPKYVYRIGPDDVMQSIAHVLAVLKEKSDVKTIAIGAPDYEWGHDVVTRFKQIMLKFKPDVKFTYEFFHPFGTAGPNFAPYITHIMQEKPDVYVGYSWGSDGVAWHNQAEAMGLYKSVPLVFDVFSGTAKGEMAREGALAETRAGDGTFPPYALGYPDSKFTPMILEKTGVLPTYGMDIHMLTGLLYLKKAYEKAYDLTGQYPSPETVAKLLDGLSIIGPDGVASMLNHQSTAPGMAVGKLHQENGHWVMKDMMFVPDYLRIVPPWMTVPQFIDALGKLNQ
ncbi:MAG: ABC transporter substrate-binding protein [Desulfobaccales bacterium]